MMGMQEQLAKLTPHNGVTPPGAGATSTQGLITAIQQLVQGQALGTAAINALTAQIAASLPIFVAVPANSGSAGAPGQMSYDAGFFYICVSGNTWRRVAIVAF